MRTAIALLSVIVAAGCSRPPGEESFVASSLPSAFVSLHSPNGQQQLLIERFGSRWQGILDDTFASTSVVVVADSGDGLFPEFVRGTGPGDPPVDISAWKKITGRPGLVVDAWAATDPGLRTEGPSAIVSLIRLAGDSAQVTAINSSLAAELEGAIGLAPPPGDTLVDPGAVASRVAVEAALHAVVDEDSGAVRPGARMAVLQIPVFLTDRFLAVEHFVFEDSSGSGGGSSVSRFTLHDLKSGEAMEPDALLDTLALDRLNAIVAGYNKTPGETPVAWHPSRPGVVLVFPPNTSGVAKRIVLPWRTVLAIVPEDSPLRAIADSIH